MEATTIVLLLLSAVVASSLVERTAPLPVPLPFFQIALGAAVGELSNFRVDFEPELFLLLFIAPLLFLDGWRIPREGLLHDKWTICALAFGLVVVTVVGAGCFIHWLIPSMPFAIAFALAAVLSPTDAVAVSAIAARSPLPRRLLLILEGESLLNDASGLVCLRFAVTAALTGSFSIGEAFLTFLWLAAGGVAAGAAVALVANAVKDEIARRFGEEPGTQILISLLIPFGAYLTADLIDGSGILAAVAAGIAMSHEERSGRALPVTRIRRAAVWDAVQFAGNGVVFVLLGLQLPAVLAGAGRAIATTGHESALWILVYVLAIVGALATLRALWAWTTLRLILFRGNGREPAVSTPGWRLVAVTTLAGVRGAVTLAGVMTLPLAVQADAAFPTRDFAILLAAGVIMASLVAAAIGLPLLMRGMRLPTEALARRQEEDEARRAASEAAIRAIETSLKTARADGGSAELYIRAGRRILARYRQRIEARAEAGTTAGLAWTAEEIEHSLVHLALDAERREFYRFARSGRLTDEATRALVRELDLEDARIRDG